jgi:hypothetical protein
MSAFGLPHVLGVLVLSGLAASAGCTAEVPTEPTGANAPRVTGVTPQAPIASAAPQVLEIRGEHLSAGLSLTLAAPDGETILVPPSEIAALDRSSFQTTVSLGLPGPYSLTVRNASNEVSPPFVMTVVANPDQTQPTVSGVVPSSLTRSTTTQRVLVQGANFAAGLSVSVVDPDGLISTQTAGAVESLTSTSFELAMMFSKVGTYSLRVINPSGDTSNVAHVVVGL